MEIRVNEFSLPAPITFNFESLKSQITATTEQYSMALYTADDMATAKADRAKLNKLKKALNDERIRREREYMEPFAEFKMQIGELCALCDKPIAAIDAQIKAYEDVKKQEKQKEVEAYFDGLDKPDFLTLDRIWDSRWLNASMGMPEVRRQIDEKVGNVKTHLGILERLGEYKFEAMQFFMESLSIDRTMVEVDRLRRAVEAKKAAEAAVKPEPVQIAMPEPIPFAEPEPSTEEEKAEWIGFEALLTVSQAEALADFFQKNGIEFRAI